MKTKIVTTTVFFLFILFGFGKLFAQELTALENIDTLSVASHNSKWSLAVVAGGKAAQNILVYETGIQVAVSLAKGHRVRLEGLIRDSSRDIDLTWGSYDLKALTDMKTLMAAVGYEWYPFVGNNVRGKFAKSLKLKGGVYYLDNPDYKFDAFLKDEVRWGDVVFTADEVGSVATKVQTNNVQPFLGFGYDTFYSGKRINLVVEGGVSYHGRPSVLMDATNMLRPTVSQAPILENNLDGYRYMPFLQISLQYNL